MPTTRVARWRPAQWSRRKRRIGTVVMTVVVICAVGFTSYRTLRPTENLSTATSPLPSLDEVESLSFGALESTPIILEGRLRVFAEQRKVWAETPVNASQQVTPYWSYRRWPSEAVGVVGVERQFLWGGQSLVVTKWSDGAVVALAAETGSVVWQTDVEPDPDEVYQGRQTGGNTVYASEGMFTAVSSADGSLVLLVTGKDQVHAYDPYTGQELWSTAFTGESGCHSTDWTGETTYIVKDSCSSPAVLEVYDAATGQPLTTWRPPGASAGPDDEGDWYVEPASCRLGRSRCELIEASGLSEVISSTQKAKGEQGVVADTYRLSASGTITAEGVGESDTALVVDDVLVEPMLNGYVWAWSRTDGSLLWTSTRPVLLLTIDGSHVYLADRDRDILIVDLHSGLVNKMIDIPARYGNNWLAGHVYVHDGFLAVERLGSGDESDDDSRYYYGVNAVLLVGLS